MILLASTAAVKTQAAGGVLCEWQLCGGDGECVGPVRSLVGEAHDEAPPYLRDKACYMVHGTKVYILHVICICVTCLSEVACWPSMQVLKGLHCGLHLLHEAVKLRKQRWVLDMPRKRNQTIASGWDIARFMWKPSLSPGGDIEA
jgi:hypothetical protein